MVVDSNALEKRRQELVPRSTVQVVDEQANGQLRQKLEQVLQAVEQQAKSDQQRI